MGVGVFAVSTGAAILCAIAALLIIFAARALNARLGHTRGIRIGRVFGGGSASWLVLPWILILGGLCVLGYTLVADTSQLWPGALVAVAAVPVTAAFGYGYDHVRLRSGDITAP